MHVSGVSTLTVQARLSSDEESGMRTLDIGIYNHMT